MDLYALKNAMAEIRRELRNTGIDHKNFSDSQLIGFAFKALMLDEMKTLNRNFERFNDFNSNKR
jgi:hypothetical protein